MKNSFEDSFNDLVEAYLGTRLPRELAAPISLADEPRDARNFFSRMFQLMERTGYPATSFTPYLIRWLNSIKTTLPSAWGGKIPPLTVPNRHKKLDAYVRGQERFQGIPSPVFLDMGCGFPPVTTSETAQALKEWKVFGIDHSFPEYIVYNEEGHYACFDENKNFQYFQAMMTPSGRTLYQDPEKTRTDFKALFSSLEKEIPFYQERQPITVEQEGCRLTRNHVLNFETENLRFLQSDFREVQAPPANVIRGMNLLIYFEPEIRKGMIRQIGKFLDDDGLMIVGTNGLGIQARYCVYERDGQNLIPREFAFSADNLGPLSFMAWFTIHEKDTEAWTLARLSKIIRSHDSFWREFSNEMDRLLEDHELCWRGPDGFFQIPEQEMQYSQYMVKHASMWEELDAKGYIDGVMDVLRSAGYEVWKNCVGDIAVSPEFDWMM